MFIIWSSGVSTCQRLLKYWSEWKDSWDFWNCLLYCECLQLRGVSTELRMYSNCILEPIKYALSKSMLRGLSPGSSVSIKDILFDLIHGCS